jgi:hypothetical protein
MLHGMKSARLIFCALVVALTANVSCAPAAAQSIEPRAYSAAPVGTNFAILVYSEAHGALPVDTALPLSDIDLEVRSALFAYARSVNLWGKSGKFDIIGLYGKLAGDAVYKGEPVERRVSGLGDAAARLTILLHGAPAMTPAEFRNYRQDLLIGASVQLFVPIGQYDKERLLNLSSNRWAIKPEVGMSKAWGQWTLEGAAGATFFGANKHFFGGHERTQKPIYSIQGHLIYNVAPGTWVAANLSWFAGGRTSIDGVDDHNLQKNWRAGVIGALPLNRRVSLKANASKGVSARTGNNFDLYGLAVQYRWGAGS